MGFRLFSSTESSFAIRRRYELEVLTKSGLAPGFRRNARQRSSGEGASRGFVKDSDHIGMTPAKPQHDLVRKALTRAFKQRRLVVVETTGDKSVNLPYRIAHSHAMAVIGWNADKDQVTIWNPWGNTGEPKRTDPDAGYQTVNGIFIMPLKDFTRSFAHVHVENDTPYKPKR